MYAGRVARHGYSRNRRWGMWLVEKYWTEEDGQADASRTTYNFDWTNESVIKSERIILVQNEEEKVYDPELITTDETAFNPDWFNAIHQMGKVTKAECEWLIRDLKQFSQSSQNELHYNR